MKVLNVNITLDPVTGGGTAERTFQLSRFLAQQGVECSLLTLDIGLTDRRRRELADVDLVALPCLNRRFYLPKSGLGQIERLVARADVVHLMGHWNLLNVLVQRFCRRHATPYVVCPAGELAVFGRSRRLKACFNAVVGRRVVRQASACVAITRLEAGQFADYGVPREDVRIIPNGIDPRDFDAGDPEDFRARHNLGDSPLLLFVGRLNSIKGADLLLHAFAAVKDRFPQYRLAFVGPDGGMERELRQTVAERGLGEQVRFLGYLGGADKAAAYRAADLLAIPSRQEAMSIVVLEAGVVGTPVLLTDQCGFDEVAEIGGGRVVPATAAGIEAGLVELLSQPQQLASLGRRLSRHVHEHFCWESLVGRYLDLYRELLDSERHSERHHEPQYSRHRRVGVCR